MKYSAKKALALLAALMLIAALFTACGKSESQKSTAYDIEAPMEAPSPSYEYSAGGLNSSAAQVEEFGVDSGSVYDESSVNIPEGYGLKIIYSAELNIETDEFDDSLDAIKAAIKDCNAYITNTSEDGGFVRNGNYRSRSLQMTVRVPSDNYRRFMDSSSDFGSVTRKYEYTDDITSQYVDLEARLSTLKTQETRLLELLAKAENISDLLTIESELSNVRYQIESFTSQMKKFDDLVSFSTITVYIDEVVEYSLPTETFGQRVKAAIHGSWVSFVDFLSDSAIFLIYALPILIVLAIIAYVIVLIVRAFIRVKAKRAAKKPEMTQQTPVVDAEKNTEKTE